MFCNKLKEYLGEELFALYKKLPFLDEKGISEFKKQVGDIDKFFDDISKKFPNTKEYNEFLKIGLETRTIITSHIYSYIKKSAKYSSLKNTLDKLNELLSKTGEEFDKSLNKLEIEFSNNKNYIDYVIKDDSLTKEQKQELTKIYDVDNELYTILNIKNKRELKKKLREYLKKKEVELAELNIARSDLGLDVVGAIKNYLNKMKDGETFFFKHSTLKRNLKRFYDNNLLNNFDNIWQVYNESLGAYNDIINKIDDTVYKNTDKLTHLKNRLSVLNKQYGAKFELRGVNDNGLAIIYDTKTNNPYIINLNDMSTSLNDVVNYYKISKDEISTNQLGHSVEITSQKDSRKITADNTLQGLEETDDVLKQIRDILNRDDINDNELFKVRSVLNDLQNRTNSRLELNNNQLDLLINRVGEYISDTLSNKLKDLVIRNFGINFFINKLLTNIELIERTDPDLADDIKKLNYVNETDIKQLEATVFKSIEQTHFLDDKVIDEYIKKDALYSVLDALNRKGDDEIIDDIITHFEAMYDQEYKGLDINEQTSKLSNYVRQINQQYSTIKQDILDNLEIRARNEYKRIVDSRDRYGVEGYIAYIVDRYENPGYVTNLIVDTYKQVAKGDIEKFEDQLLNEILKLRNGNKNILGLFEKLRTNYRPIDRAWSVAMGNTTNISYIKTSLLKGGLSEKTANRVLEDLYGKAIINSKLLSKIRGLAYKFSMSILGGKGIAIAGNNLISNLLEGLSFYNNTKDITYKEFFNLINSLNTDKYKKIYGQLEYIFKQDIYSPFDTEVSKYVEENRLTLDVRLANRFNRWISKKLDGLYGSSYEIYKKNFPAKLVGFITNPAGVVDEISKSMIIKDNIYNYVFDKLGYTIEDIKSLINDIKKGDQDALQELITLLKDAKRDALHEYQILFKSSYHTGLTRNALSRIWYLNFFSSWGSKKFADYFTNIITDSLNELYKVTKFTGSIREGIIAATKHMLSDRRFNALMKQIYVLSYINYQITKENLGTDNQKTILEATLPGQATMSFFITRSLLQGLQSYFDVEGDSKDKLTFAVFNTVSGFIKNFLKDYTIIANLVAAPSVGLIKNGPDGAYQLFAYNFAYGLNSALLYNIFDVYKGVYRLRFDGKSDIGVIEGLSGIPLTKWSEDKQELMNIKNFNQFLKNPLNWITSRTSFNFLGVYFGGLSNIELSKASKQLAQDTDFLNLRDKAVIPKKMLTDKKYIDSLWKLASSHGLLTGWDKNSKTNQKTAFVLSELRSKGYDIDKLMSTIQSSITNKKYDTALKLLAGLQTREGATMLVSYMMKQKYNDTITALSKQLGLKISQIPEDKKEVIKAQILQEYGPVLMGLDKSYHADVLGLYIQNEYGLKPSSNAYKEVAARLFTHLLDLKEIDFKPSLFTSLPVKLLQGINGTKNKIKFIDDMFKKIDGYEISYNTKTLAKTALIYGNITNIKDMLFSNYEKYGPYINKLAELIYKTSDEITKNPAILDGLLSSGSKIKVGKIPAVETLKLARDIKTKMSRLKEIVLKYEPVKNTIKPIRYSKLHLKPLNININLPDEKAEIRRIKPRPIKPGTIRAELLKTREKYIKSKHARKPKVQSIKKAYGKTKTNTGSRTKIKPSRVNR